MTGRQNLGRNASDESVKLLWKKRELRDAQLLIGKLEVDRVHDKQKQRRKGQVRGREKIHP